MNEQILCLKFLKAVPKTSCNNLLAGVLNQSLSVLSVIQSSKKRAKNLYGVFKNAELFSSYDNNSKKNLERMSSDFFEESLKNLGQILGKYWTKK